MCWAQWLLCRGMVGICSRVQNNELQFCILGHGVYPATYEEGWASLVVLWYRICLPMQEMWVQSLGQEDALEKEMALHPSSLAWKIPWTEEPSGLPSMELQRVRHDLGTKQQQQQWGIIWPIPKREMRDILPGDLGLNTGWTECYLSSHRTITNYVQKRTQLLNINKHKYIKCEEWIL